MHQSFFRPNYIFNNDGYFLDFRAQKFLLIFFNVNPFKHQQALHFGFWIMKNNIKKAPVKFWEDLLHFQHFMLIFVFAPISDYHHLNAVWDRIPARDNLSVAYSVVMGTGYVLEKRCITTMQVKSSQDSVSFVENAKIMYFE